MAMLEETNVLSLNFIFLLFIFLLETLNHGLSMFYSVSRNQGFQIVMWNSLVMVFGAPRGPIAW